MSKLIKTPGAIAYLVALFLNAFIDLGHKIIIQNTLFKAYDGQEQVICQPAHLHCNWQADPGWMFRLQS